MTLTTIQQPPRLRTFEVCCEPPPDFESYPEEVVRITVFDDHSVVAVPVGVAERPWLHRYPRMPVDTLVYHLVGAEPPDWLLVFGALCLEYPWDPDKLRWSWAKGFDTYLQMVQRHLLAEEFTRRYGQWPVEDAPHGFRRDGRPHPLTTPMTWAA